jgi:hypothetical protein
MHLALPPQRSPACVPGSFCEVHHGAGRTRGGFVALSVSSAQHVMVVCCPAIESCAVDRGCCWLLDVALEWLCAPPFALPAWAVTNCACQSRYFKAVLVEDFAA